MCYNLDQAVAGRAILPPRLVVAFIGRRIGQGATASFIRYTQLLRKGLTV